MSAHTPGPWRHGHPLLQVVDTAGRVVCIVRCASQHPAVELRAHENARLIARAPELLAQVEALTAQRDALMKSLRSMVDLVEGAEEGHQGTLSEAKNLLYTISGVRS